MIQLKRGIPPASLDQPRTSANRQKNKAVKRTNTGLHFERVFSDASLAPFDQIQWEERTAEITDDSGKVIFKQENIEVPKSWSALATKIAVSKYFYGDIANGTDPYNGGRETSVRQLIHRVTRTIADWGLADGYFADAKTAEIFYDELAWLCLNQHGAFNSPVWFNVGLYHQYGIGKGAGAGNYFYNRETGKAERAASQYEYPQGSACFIQSVGDTMEDIMRLATSEAMLFKYGSGTGTDLSSLRSIREKLSGGGKPSGPLSFLKVYDQVANVVKSGGKTRRAAKMNTLKDWHPDIEEFIDAKQKEEKKAWALIDPHRPVSEPIGFIARTNDESRPNNQSFSWEPILGFLFRKRFEWAVRFVTGSAHRFECFFVRIGSVVLRERRSFVHAFARVRVNGNRRNKNVAPDVAFQDLRGITHPCWKSRRIINYDIPLSIFECVELAVAIADQLLDFSRQFTGMRLSAIECRHLVSATKRITNLIRSGESGATEDEDAQRFHGFFCE